TRKNRKIPMFADESVPICTSGFDLHRILGRGSTSRSCYAEPAARYRQGVRCRVEIMPNHELSAKRVMMARPGVAFALTVLLIVPVGGAPPRADLRDREVLEAALRDIVHQQNTVYERDRRHDKPPSQARTIVLHRLAGGDDDTDIFIYTDVFKDQKMVSTE